MTIEHHSSICRCTFGILIHWILGHRCCGEGIYWLSSLLEQTRCYLHSCVEDKVFSGVAQCEVVGGDGWFLWIKSGLVTSQPSFVANDSWGVDQWSSQVNVDIRVDLDILLSVGNLDLSVFASAGWRVLLVFGIINVLIKTYPVCGAKVPSKDNFNPLTSWSWTAASENNVLSVFHFSVTVRP